MRAAALCLVAIALASCAKIDSPDAEVVLPSDYRTSFVQVRGCRSSIDHDLMNVVVRVRNDQAALYDDGPYPMPEHALVVKEQYRDNQCHDLAGYTVMRKEGGGYFPAGGDWQYFSLDAFGSILMQGQVARCAGCHAMCTKRDRLCTEP
jgi:hypothetical protein